jgi:2-polyprenyl-3-methyl-5-hydroxy-6-metoxy-1,4-benzoquinol methylase
MKKFIVKLLKFVKSLFKIINIDIAFVKKEKIVDSVDYNSNEGFDEYYSHEGNIKELKTKEHLLFFKLLVIFFEQKGIDLNGKIIADFGCGIGNLICQIRKNFDIKQTYGFDFSEKAINIAKNIYKDVNFEAHDIYVKTNQKFDFIISTETLEHLLHPEKAAKNLIDQINFGGKLLVTVPDGRIDTFKGHINFWSPESWKVFIENQCTEDIVCETGYITEEILYALISKRNSKI